MKWFFSLLSICLLIQDVSCQLEIDASQRWYLYSSEYVDLFTIEEEITLSLILAGSEENNLIYTLSEEGVRTSSWALTGELAFEEAIDRSVGELLVADDGWYFRQMSSLDWQFLYHFDYQIGDSLEISDDSTFHVDSIGFIEVGEDLHKVFYDSDLPFYLIENFGWNTGILTTELIEFTQLFETQFLTCIEKADDQVGLDYSGFELLFPKADFSFFDCETPKLTFTSNPAHSVTIDISPNPVSQYLQVSDVGIYHALQIIDSHGIIKYAKEVHASQLELDVSMLSNGMYFIVMTGIGSVVSIPFLKM